MAERTQTTQPATGRLPSKLPTFRERYFPATTRVERVSLQPKPRGIESLKTRTPEERTQERISAPRGNLQPEERTDNLFSSSVVGRLIKDIPGSETLSDAMDSFYGSLAPPTRSEQMWHAYQENPTRSNDQLAERAEELDEEQFVSQFGDERIYMIDDFTGGMARARAGSTVAKNVIDRIARSTDPEEIGKVVQDINPKLSNQQRDVVTEILKNTNDAKKIGIVLEKASVPPDQLKRFVKSQSTTDGPQTRSLLEQPESAATRPESADTMPDRIAEPEDIDQQFARRSFEGVSFKSEKRGDTVREEYADGVNSMYRELMEKAETPEQKQIVVDEMRRFRDRYLKEWNNYLSRKSRVFSPMISGAGNFPVQKMKKRNELVGKKMDEIIEMREKTRRSIERKMRRQNVVDEGGELAMAQRQLDELKASQERMKKANAIIRSKKTTDDQKIQALQNDLNFSADQAQTLMAGDFAGRKGFASFELTNNNAKIKRLDERVKSLAKKETQSGVEDAATFEGGRIVINRDIDRVQIFFDEMPDPALRAELKSSGWRWSRNEGAWQRKPTNNAYASLRRIFGDRGLKSEKRRAQEDEAATTARDTTQASTEAKTLDTTQIEKEASDYGVELELVNRKPTKKERVAGKYRDGKIVIYTKDSAGNPISQDRLEDVFYHELGHEIDYKRRGIIADPMGDSIRDPDGQVRPARDSDVYFRGGPKEKEAAAIREVYPNNRSLTQKEIYADAYKLYRRDPDRLREIAPTIHKEIEDYVKTDPTPSADELVAKKSQTAPEKKPATEPDSTTDGVENAQTRESGEVLQQRLGKDDLDPDEQAVELRAFNKLAADREGMIQRYIEDNDNYVSADTAKSYFDDYPNNPARHANATHRPSMELATAVYERVLRNAPPDQPVLFTSGGTAAGKTYGVKTKAAQEQNAAILDSNLAAYGTASRLIDEALSQGREVRVRYTYADPETAFLRAIARAQEEGRTIPVETHISTHNGSAKVIRRLFEEYGQNDRVQIDVIDNTDPRDAQVTVDDPLDFLADKTYSGSEAKALTQKLYDEVTKQYQDGDISADIARGFGVAEDTVSQGQRSDRGRDAGGRQTLQSQDQAQNLESGRARSARQPNRKLEERAQQAQSFDEFQKRTGITEAALDRTAQEKGYQDAADFYDHHKSAFSETDSLELAAEQNEAHQFYLRPSAKEEEQIVDNLTATFADLKGLSVEDLNIKFTPEDLERAELEYQFVAESILDDPARHLTKYASAKTGTLPEVTGQEYMTAIKGRGKVRTSEFGRRGDDIVTELGFKDSDEAREAYEQYRKRKQDLERYKDKVKEIRRQVQLAKQRDKFVGREKQRLARELAMNQQALQRIVKAAERSGFSRGVEAGRKQYKSKYERLISNIRARRTELTRIKKRYNLTDSQFRNIRREKYTDKNGDVKYKDRDPRFMDEGEFQTFLRTLEDKAKVQHEKNQERLVIEAIIQEKDLKKTENLQRALEMPPVNQMSVEQLREFSEALSQTRPGDTFLGPRMIQTAVNTDLGNIRTMQDGIDRMIEQTGMPAKQFVEGKKFDRWLRDPALVERDPLHKMFITEWTAKETKMMTQEFQLKRKLDDLAKKARRSRRKQSRSLRERFFDRIAPQDEAVVRYTEATPEMLPKLQEKMTAEEIEFGDFLRGFFQKYYNLVANDAADRWTLRGVKYTRFKDMYFPHMKRSLLEKWRDDGFIKAIRVLWGRNIETSKIDFQAFGNRGEVLGYEKWLKYNMRREGAKTFSQNAPRVAMAYFNAFERKLLLDSMIPKVKLYEFLVGKRFETPKSIDNPTGAEEIHSELRKHVNEWINNKKGQRIEMLYEQGDRAEAVVNGLRTFISVMYLGGNVITQTVSAFGGQVASLRGAGIKGWATGQKRAYTKRGVDLAAEHPGVIGENAWNALADAANDMGDTLQSGLFYIFADASYKARRTMFLGLLTPDEFKTGNISDRRLAEIKLEIGKWHPLPEQRSIAGSTSAVKAATMFTEWAMPIFQTTAFDHLPKLYDLVRRTDPKDWPTVAKSKEFKNLAATVFTGVGTGVTAYWLLNPDENDRSSAGYLRRRTAEELSTILQGATLFGAPMPMSIFVGYLDRLRSATWVMLSLQEYETYGPGYAPGDLKGPRQLRKLFTPSGVKLWLSEPETPLPTEDSIREEIREQYQNGEISLEAAREKAMAELKNLRRRQKERYFEEDQDAYRATLRQRVQQGELSIEEAYDEAKEYLKQKQERDPESFEADSEKGFIENVKTYAEAIGTDPVTAFQYLFQGEEIRRTDNGTIIVSRMPFEESQEARQDRGAKQGLILDHTIPLQLGGDNGDDNLKLVPEEDWKRYTPVENFLGQALRTEDIDGKTAQELIRKFKAGELTEEQVYAEVERQTTY